MTTDAAQLNPYRGWLRLLARLQIDRRFQGKFDASDICQSRNSEPFLARVGPPDEWHVILPEVFSRK